MNTARIVVLEPSHSVPAAVAAYLAKWRRPTRTLPAETGLRKIQTVDVSGCQSRTSGLGQTVAPEDLQWQDLAKPRLRATILFRRKRTSPKPPRKLAGSIATPPPIIAGETDSRAEVGQGQWLGLHGRPILPTGPAALSRPKSRRKPPLAASFLPNDRVDVILSRRLKNPGPHRSNRYRRLGSHLGQCFGFLAYRSGAEGKRERPERGGRQGPSTLELRAGPDGNASPRRRAQAGTLSAGAAQYRRCQHGRRTTRCSGRAGGINVVRYGRLNFDHDTEVTRRHRK